MVSGSWAVLGIGHRAGERRKRDGDAESSIREGAGTDGGVVAGGDGSDNGQPEAVTVLVVRAPGIEALKWSEEPVDFTGRKIGPVLVTLSTAVPSAASVEI